MQAVGRMAEIELRHFIEEHTRHGRVALGSHDVWPEPIDVILTCPCGARLIVELDGKDITRGVLQQLRLLITSEPDSRG